MKFKIDDVIIFNSVEIWKIKDTDSTSYFLSKYSTFPGYYQDDTGFYPFMISYVDRIANLDKEYKKKQEWTLQLKELLSEC